MFRRVAHHLPKDPVFPTTLEELGLRVTEDLQFVDASTGKHIDNFVTDNEHYNGVRKEAIHLAARRQMIAEAAKQGMQEIYICDKIGENGRARLEETKPEGKHITVLTTKLEQLRNKDDIIILVGDRNQDLGVFAYRSFMRRGGIYGASVVGLMKLLNEINDQSLPKSPKAEQKPPDARTKLNIPGLIVLNPGQLYYSHALNTCMTLTSWQDRRRQFSTDDPFRIDDEHNLFHDHRDAYAHLQSFFDHVLPKITNAQAKLYVIGIEDGADNLVQFLTRKQEYLHEGRVQGAFFVQPMPDATENPLVVDFLAKNGRSWVSSEEARGRLVQVPECTSQTLDWNGTSSITGSATNVASDEQPSIDYEQVEPIKPDPVLCPTFSCGFTDVTELIFPSVMDEAVKFILGRIEQVHAGT